MQGVVVGSAGSVFVTDDGGDSWKSTAEYDNRSNLRAVASVAPPVGLVQPGSTVGIDAAAKFYLLTRHEELAEWRRWTNTELLMRLRESPVRRKQRICQERGGVSVD